ncbi:hypothetical protein Tco_1141672 [Tanacetum coccineum]
MQASSAAFFPFTEQGFLEFKKYEYSRMCDAHGLLRRAKELEERAECLGLADALRRRACPLGPRVKALLRRTYALERLHHKREEEIAKAEHALERKEKLAEKAAAKAKNKGEKEAEKVAEKKHKDKEKKGACESAAAVLIVPLAVGYTLYA